MEVLTIHCGPVALLLDILAVRLGRGISRKRATSMIASRLEIEPEAAESAYTLDGDLYSRRGPVSVELGPSLHIIRPGTTKVPPSAQHP
jgi:hypothetical protein